MVQSVKGGSGRGQVTASTGRGRHRGCAGQSPLGGGRPPARVEAEEARGQDAQLQEDHSSACNRINGTDNVLCYAMIALPAVITTGRVVQTSSLSLSSPRMKTEIRRQLKFSSSSAELELF